MTTKQTPVAFTNREGLQLFGILEQPERVAPGRLGVLMLSPGVKMRVGPQRVYLRLSRMFADAGLPVLRFDFKGLGDSEGTLSEDLLKDVYNHIEVGRFVDDTIDAMNWMEKHHGVNQFILSGLCGGAITGLLTASRDPRVAGLLGLGITPLLASRAADPSAYMTGGQLDQIGQSYIRKLTDPKSWLRLLTMQSDYRLLWRALRKRIVKTPPAAPAPATAVIPEGDNASPLFPPAFFKMTGSKRPQLLIFGGGDRLHWEFEEKFVARYRERLAAEAAQYQIHVIAQANHVLSLEPWQREMLDVSRAWLTSKFSGKVAQDAVT